ETHRTAGFHTMIVSGAFTVLLEMFQELYEVDTIVGTNLPAKHEPLQHIHAENKIAAIFATTNPTAIDWDASYAYGDIISHKDVLVLVCNTVAVYSDHELAALAQKNKWKILTRSKK